MLKFHDLFYDGGFLANKELPVEKIKSFLEQYKTNFDNYAAFHIKAIKKHLKNNKFSPSISIK
jgi:hypothetical protein